jgi:hypothetical protein
VEIGFGLGVGIGWVLGVFCYAVYRMRPDTKVGTPSASHNRTQAKIKPCQNKECKMYSFVDDGTNCAYFKWSEIVEGQCNDYRA